MTTIQHAAHHTSEKLPENQEPPPSGLPSFYNSTITHAESYFGLKQWSQDTLHINTQGHLTLEIDGVHLDLYSLAKKLAAEKQWPVLLRFPALITKNIAAIQNAFAKAIHATEYQNQYTLAYPLKVNPHASVVKTMMQSSYAERITFEVGSKAELLIALTQTKHEQRIMCNGFKDEAYLSLVWEAAEAGQKVCLIFETIDEVHHLLTLLSQRETTLPEELYLGLRLRLSTPVAGHWEDSNGKHSKFGLSSTEAIHLINILKRNHCLSHLKAMHIHPGSQILLRSELRGCFRECVRYYHELLKLHAPIQYVDIGGGLGMDYSAASEEKLRDYTLDDYAMTIIEQMEKYCRENNLPQPHIISETGRNTVALSSMLLTNVEPLGELNEKHTSLNSSKPFKHFEKTHSVYLQQLWESHLFILSLQNDQQAEAAHKQQDFLFENIRQEFLDNQLSLEEMAWAEKIYNENQFALNGSVSYQKYLANFSVFQSMPDYWGIQQFFPLLSLHGYNHELTRSAVFYDLTCDSDGVVKHYLHPEKLQPQLRMPDCPVEFIGIFLMGAYQEIMASGHNLFETLPCLDIVWNAEKHQFDTQTYQACNIADSLTAIGYNEAQLIQRSEEKFKDFPMNDLLQNSLESTSYLEHS